MLSLTLRNRKEILSKKIKNTLLASGLIFSLGSSFTYAESLSDMVHDKDSWIYKKIHSAKDEAIKKIEKEINAAFKEAVIDKMIEKMSQEFGEEIGKTLTSFVGIGPFFSFAMLASGGGGPSETQIMMQVLLEAIDDARDEIIDAVEQNFQDETESDLNALILALDIYNSRDMNARKLEYQLLSDMSYYASRIKKRLEQKTSKAVDNSHLYLLVAGLHVEIEKQYTHWLTLHVNPSASEEEIQSNFDSVLDVMVRDSYKFINEGAIGSLASWRASFENSFSDKVEFAGYVPANEIPQGRNYDDAYYFSYKFNDKPIKFKVLGGKGCALAYRNYYFYDSVNGYLGSAIGGCKTNVGYQVTLVQKNIGMVVNAHKADSASFNKYVLDGYVPIREIFDLWWRLAFDAERPKSEVDIFVDELLEAAEAEKPSACEISGKSGEYVGNSPFGGAYKPLVEEAIAYCSPCGVWGKSSDRGAAVSFYCAEE